MQTYAMQYTRNPPLDESDLRPEPMAQLGAWIDQARATGLLEPTAMALATADPDGQPSVRIVLFKGFAEDGLCFYTDYRGRKGQELARNPRVAATFWWDRLERQVRVEGQAQRLPAAHNQAYFSTRPRESQLGALTSHQSQVVATREELDQRLAANSGRWEGQTLPCPEHWGGYLIRPQVVEFWQGRRGRLHDRLRYRRSNTGWVIERLEP